MGFEDIPKVWFVYAALVVVALVVVLFLLSRRGESASGGRPKTIGAEIDSLIKSIQTKQKQFLSKLGH